MIFLITNRNICGETQLLLRIREAALAGVDYILLRENDLDDPAYRNLTLSALQMLTGSKTELVVCHRDHIADEFGLKKHNRYKERGTNSFSVATHNHEEAENHQATYFFYSPIFETACKPGVQPKGIGYKRDNMIALGGINKKTVHGLKGIAHVGIMSEWLETNSVNDLVKYYRGLKY